MERFSNLEVSNNIVKLQERSTEIEMNKSVTLNRIQRFVCKIFKIEPAQRYDCVITIYPMDNKLRINDMIMVNKNENKFLIMSSGIGNNGELMMVARSLNLLLEKPFIENEVLFFANAHPEGNYKNR